MHRTYVTTVILKYKSETMKSNPVKAEDGT